MTKTTRIEQTISKVAAQKQVFKTADVLRVLGYEVSRQYVVRVLKRLVQQGTLAKAGTTRGSFYAFPEHLTSIGQKLKRRLRNESLQEDEVLANVRAATPGLRDLPKNVNAIFAYAFSEMLNNAIEHSGSKFIEIETALDRDLLTFAINDSGVGVFRNVMRQRKLKSEFEAIQDLLKGKTTTAPKLHSGEGIFFTSKVADLYVLDSFGYRLRVDNKIDDYFIERTKRKKRGTKVTFSIARHVRRRLQDIFNNYSVETSDPAFDRSEVKVKLFTRGNQYVSRSEARRLLAGLERFRTVVLDFTGVKTVGQAFADEVFRVFAEAHPRTKIAPINMEEPVRLMVHRAKASAD